MRTYAEGDAAEDFKGGEAWSSKFAEPETVFDILKVKDILPHRYPFLLVDKIIEFVPGKKAVGIKKVTTNEEFFNGHFPERPIMPGVLQLEAMAQVGASSPAAADHGRHRRLLLHQRQQHQVA